MRARPQIGIGARLGASASPSAREAVLSAVPHRSIVEGIPAITYVDRCVRGASHGVYVSPQVWSLLGYTPQEWLADPHFRSNHAHRDDRDRVAQLDRAAREEALPYEAEYRLTAKSGAEVWFHDRTRPAADPEGAVTVHGVMLAVTLTDVPMAGSLAEIADRKRFEAVLRESEQQFRQLFEASPDATVLIDPNDTSESWPIVDCNAAACRMNGFSREEIVGKSIDALNGTTGTPEERAAYLDRLRREGVISLETEHRHKDGHVFPVEVSTSLITFGGRELVLGIDRDITERKQIERALQQALDAERDTAERLRELDEMKNAFLTAVSHDLRAPLTVVLGSSLTLERLRPTLSVEDQDRLIHSISHNAHRLQRMLDDLLDLDRLTRGILEPLPAPADLAPLVARLIEDSGIEEDHVVHVDVEPLRVNIDAPKVERIIDNLVTNARRHTEAGTAVWIAIRRAEGGLLLIVEDAGPGVPEACRTQVFEPFKQLGQPSPQSLGVGIGLALVARFAELHGGRAWVEERVGGGASFRVFLLATDATDEPEPPS
jgi:PAS domain S-box-containing protein